MPKNLKYLWGTCILLLGISQGWATINGNGHKGVVRTLSAQAKGQGKMSIGLGANYAQDGDFVKGPNGQGSVIDNNTNVDITESALESAKLLSSNLYLGIGAARWLDFAVMLPFYYDWTGFANKNDGGLGDVEVSAKILYPPQKDRRVYYQAYYLGVSVPIGFRSHGLFPRHPYFKSDDTLNPANTYYSSDVPVIKPMILWTFDIGSVVEKFQFKVNFNFGGALNTRFGDRNNTLIAGLALEYAPIDVIEIFVDVWGESRVSNFSSGFKITDDPLHLTPGVKINTPTGIYISLAADLGLASIAGDTRNEWYKDKYRYSTAVMPKWGVQFMFGWDGFLAVQDDDRDGIKNDIDRCPKDAEDLDGFEDSDGCPDTDNDKDGIDDVKDKCPGKAEDQDGFEDEDGCPDPDNDGDGIPDQQDQCPRQAEDFDGYEDRDGCIDEDNDKDGVADSLDKCPNDPEDVDKFEDDDGCPDIDNDKDGINDLKDKCPNEAETLNGLDDTDGCPDTKKKEPKMPKHQILRGVNFRSGSVEMTFESHRYLEPILKIMKQYPQVEIEIRGHTDSVGKYASNMRLSQMRAEAVRQYLISKGIDGGRMRAVGFGPSSPIADNRTAAGRNKNRRIEVVRIK